MQNSRVINRYALAFLENSVEKNILSEAFKDCIEFIEVCNENRELQALLLNPVIKGDKKHKIINGIFGKIFHPTTLAFMELVIKNGRELLLKEIFEEFSRLYKENQRIIEAEVVSAAPLTEDVLESLKKYLIKITGYKTVELTNSINEALIGGFALKYQDKLLDYSIINKLKLLKQELIT